MRFLMVSSVVLAVLMAPAAWAADIYVQNYNWLQLPAGDVTALLGNSKGVVSSGSGNGSPNDFRWGNWVWIPNGGLTQTTATDNGAGGFTYSNGMYYAAVRLDQPREITKVGVQWWASEGASLTKYYIDGWNEGDADWTELTSYEYVNGDGVRTAKTGTRFGLYGDNSLAIPAGNVGEYQYIRVRVMEADYTYGSANRGGPGLLAIEPMGNGYLAEEKVNWANKQFNTTITGHNLTWNRGKLNSGYLFDDESDRTGDGAWDSTSKPWTRPDMYIEINLGTARTINELVAIWDGDYAAREFTLSYSGNGDKYYDVEAVFARVNGGMTSATFGEITAQYWRISYVVSASSNPERLVLFNQIMMYGPAVPEPVTMSLLAVGGLALLRRRR